VNLLNELESMLREDGYTEDNVVIRQLAKIRSAGVLSVEERDVICGACGILDVVKGEWAGSWGEYDQGIRDGLTKILARCEAERGEGRS
jgi:hypothetical protein